MRPLTNAWSEITGLLRPPHPRMLSRRSGRGGCPGRVEWRSVVVRRGRRAEGLVGRALASLVQGALDQCRLLTRNTATGQLSINARARDWFCAILLMLITYPPGFVDLGRVDATQIILGLFNIEQPALWVAVYTR
jgi:hypothetical protein